MQDSRLHAILPRSTGRRLAPPQAYTRKNGSLQCTLFTTICIPYDFPHLLAPPRLCTIWVHPADGSKWQRELMNILRNSAITFLIPISRLDSHHNPVLQLGVALSSVGCIQLDMLGYASGERK